jgi:glutaminase-like protein
VKWTTHVAPVIRVGDGATDLMVLDPSVFCRPVPVSLWKDTLVKEKGRVVYTAASIYAQASSSGGRRARRGELASDLKYFQARLLIRAEGQRFPPPYFPEQCPNDPRSSEAPRLLT